ncbi:MAG TPA: acyl-CoA dehydrogenase family protein [Verrucomicrobiae bacterium]|jgi:alkylation response protein AidB-like acyl-CoA dehydrogenase|nr:acyl-CoA dehydrogenase family protein [Verrucomicrobiae bacterium]
MDFTDSPSEAAFRADARAWLERTAERRAYPGETWKARYGEAEGLTRAKAFQAQKHAAGFAAITWATEYGGRGGTAIQQVIYNQEEARFLVPRGYFEIGLGMCIPTLHAYATEAQKQRYTPKALAGEEIWCQLFSEPAAGSDLAGLRTRSVKDGSDWLINGQKIWTSGAHFADYGIIVTRSDPKAPKHKGLTFFFLDMHAPGVEVRRIKQVSGASNFNEVYFTDVRVPDTQRLGAVGQGWGVSITTLMNERLAVGDVAGPDFDEIFALARAVELPDGPAIKNAAVRERLADWYVRQQGLRYTRFRTMTALSRGETPGPEASIAKVVSASKLQEIAGFAMDLEDMGGAVLDPALAPMRAAFQEALLYSPGGRIAGGTDEILRNIIAERVLGLPADVRMDKDLPFDELPSGSAAPGPSARKR